MHQIDTTIPHGHTEQHMRSSEILTDIVIGMSDGLTVPFALAAGLSGAVESSGIIVTAGLAEVAAKVPGASSYGRPPGRNAECSRPECDSG